MNRYPWVFALVGIAAVTFAGVAVHEWDYKTSHPYAYGPAAVIAVAGCAGVVLALAVAWMLRALHREQQNDREEARQERKQAYDSIRGQVASGELTEDDYSEWYWWTGRGDVKARTRVFQLEKEVTRLADNVRDTSTAIRTDPKAAEVLDALDEKRERDRPTGIPTIDPTNDEEWAKHYRPDAG